MTIKRPLHRGSADPVGLIVAPFVLPHLGFSPTTINRILIWGLFGLGFDIAVRLHRTPVVRPVGLLRHRRHVRRLPAHCGQLPLCDRLDCHRRRGRGRGRLSRRPDRAQAHRHLFRHDHGGDRGSILLHRVQSAVGLYRRRKRPARRADAEFRPRLHEAELRHRLENVRLPCVLVLRRLGDRAAHRPLAGRSDLERDARQPAARRPPSATTSMATNSPPSWSPPSMPASPAACSAIMQGFMPPDAFMFDTSGQLVMQTAIGGAGTLFGPLVGAVVWLYLSDFFQNALHLGATWKLVLGIVFVLLVCFLRRGIVGAIADLYALAARRRRTIEPAETHGRTGRIARARNNRRSPIVAAAERGRAEPFSRRRVSPSATAAWSPTATSTSPSIMAKCAASSGRTAPARAPSSRC